MWRRRNIIETKWIKHTTNEAVLGEVNERKTMMNLIMTSKIQLVEHLLRHNQFIVTEGKIDGKRTRRKPCVNPCLMKSSNSWGFTIYRQLKKRENDRHEWVQ